MHFREQIFGLEPVIAHGQHYEPLDNDDVYQIIKIVISRGTTCLETVSTLSKKLN